MAERQEKDERLASLLVHRGSYKIYRVLEFVVMITVEEACSVMQLLTGRGRVFLWRYRT